jgi:hypothetical protein
MILHFLLGFVCQANATSYYIQPFSQFTHEASAIAHGTLSNIHTENSVSPTGQKVIYTYATLTVSDALKGPIDNGQSVLVRKIGGTKDGYTLTIPGTPEFTEGEDTVLFMGAENSDQSREITNLELGKFGTETKDGKTTLTGGLFTYSKKSEHNMAGSVPENQHPWTLKDLRALIEKQGGKMASAQVTSTPFLDPKIVAKALANSHSEPDTHADSHVKRATEPAKALEDARSAPDSDGGPPILLYSLFGLAAVGVLFFLFRKR